MTPEKVYNQSENISEDDPDKPDEPDKFYLLAASMRPNKSGKWAKEPGIFNENRMVYVSNKSSDESRDVSDSDSNSTVSSKGELGKYYEFSLISFGC